MPEISCNPDRFSHGIDGFVVCEGPLATHCKDDRLVMNLKVMNAEVACGKQRIGNCLPGA